MTAIAKQSKAKRLVNFMKQMPRAISQENA